MSREAPSFSRVVSDALARRGLGLREFCRRCDLDPSFLSKVLAGKRNPPSDEASLRRIAAALELDPVEVIVSAGLIPTDWNALWADSELVRAVHAVATGRRAARWAAPSAALSTVRRPRIEAPPPAPPPARPPSRGLSEELL
jgi:transcriptional regulator with XRE-family HTH domain